MVVRKGWARELKHELEVESSHVLQEFELENLAVHERDVGCGPVVGSLNLYSDRSKTLS
jgi:hypothetical protein